MQDDLRVVTTGKMHKLGWLSKFLGEGVARLYPAPRAPGHGFVNGGQGGMNLEEVVACAKTAVPWVRHSSAAPIPYPSSPVPRPPTLIPHPTSRNYRCKRS